MKCYIIYLCYDWDYDGADINVHKVFLDEEKALEYYNRKEKQLERVQKIDLKLVDGWSGTYYQRGDRHERASFIRLLNCAYFTFEEQEIIE